MTLPLPRRTLPTVLVGVVVCPVRPRVIARSSSPRDKKPDTRGVRETVLVERVVGEDDERRLLEEVRLESLVDDEDDDERRVLEEVGVVRVTVRVLLVTRRLDERTLPTLPLRRTLPLLTVASSSFF